MNLCTGIVQFMGELFWAGHIVASAPHLLQSPRPLQRFSR
jgi:hypothetical protein